MLRKVFLSVFILMIFSCEGAVSKKNLDGVWIYSTPVVEDTLTFKKDSYVWEKTYNKVLVEKQEGKYRVYVKQEGKYYYNFLELENDLGLKTTFKIEVVNKYLLNIEGIEKSTYYYQIPAEELEKVEGGDKK